MTLRRPPLTAFTLIELLAVMSIMTLLIGLLMPALASARRSAHVAVCGGNLQQLGVAWHAYAYDFIDVMPPAVNLPAPIAGPPVDEITILDCFNAYVDTPEIYHCPQDDLEYHRHLGTSYEYLPGVLIALDPANAQLLADFVKREPHRVPLLSDAEPFHYPAPGWQAVFCDGHVDWILTAGAPPVTPP